MNGSENYSSHTRQSKEWVDYSSKEWVDYPRNEWVNYPRVNSTSSGSSYIQPSRLCKYINSGCRHFDKDRCNFKHIHSKLANEWLLRLDFRLETAPKQFKNVDLTPLVKASIGSDDYKGVFRHITLDEFNTEFNINPS